MNNCISYPTTPVLNPCLQLNYSMTTHVPTNLHKYSSTLLFLNSRFLASPQHSRYMNYSNVLICLMSHHYSTPVQYTPLKDFGTHKHSTFALLSFLFHKVLRNQVNFGLLTEQVAVTLRNQASDFGKQLILREVWFG